MIPSCQSRLVGSPPPFAVADLSLRLASSAARRPYDGAAASMAQYHLSAQLRGHEDDVSVPSSLPPAPLGVASRLVSALLLPQVCAIPPPFPDPSARRWGARVRSRTPRAAVSICYSRAMARFVAGTAVLLAAPNWG